MWICDKDEHCIDCPRNYPNEECEHYIEVQVIKRGRWEKYLNEGLRYRCSVCGSRYEFPWNYCPNCGASMMDEVRE